MERFDRRTWLQLLAAGALSPLIVTFDERDASAAPSAPTVLRTDSARVFDVSVASGDPSAKGIVLWTHIAPSSYVAGTPLWVQLSTSSSFASLTLEAVVSGFGPDTDCCAKAALDGLLKPGTTYYYRFIYGDTVSRVGRCRTLPSGSLSRLKLGVLTCQDFTNGYYGALRILANDTSIDFVVHLGDFIYESVGDPRFQDMNFPDRYLFMPSGSSVSLGLDDYRFLYRSYRSDPDLQLLLERHTLILAPDDHETANDCYWDYARDTLGAPDHPYVSDAAALRQLKLDAQRAWLEYVPTRVVANASATHPHAYSTVYRGFDFGDLVRISMLDTRSYRTPHPCGEGDLLQRYLPIGCTAYSEPTQSLLGTAQRSWLANQLTSSRTTWNVLGNQTLIAPLKIGYGSKPLPIDVDAWDGYQAERKWLTDLLKTNSVKNAVVLTGDLHSYVASQLLADFNNLNPLDSSNVVGVEFMTPSVTSSNLFETLNREISADQSLLNVLSEGAVIVNNPHIRYFNSSQYGYSTIEFTRNQCDWVAYAVDKNVPGTQASAKTVAHFRKYTFLPFMLPV